MVSRNIHTEQDREALVAFIGRFPAPFSISIAKGATRSVEQNRLQRLLVNEIAEQDQNHSAEWWRGYVKLTIGVPILRRDDEEFAEKYDRIIKPLPYEDKMACMMEPLDFPITRLMKVGQKTEFLNEIYKRFSEQGFRLTVPEEAA